MSMRDWAKREVELACKREKEACAKDDDENISGEEWEYGCACYKSALKAYESLMDDEHSGCSFGMTRSILTRLMEGLPLIPIEDTDDMWIECVRPSDRECGTYQSMRMSSLFKDVYPDGTVKYHDIDRCYAIDVVNGYTYGCGLADRIINEKYPITMPYYPTSQKYKVYMSDCLTDSNNGDFDTQAILYIKTPEGERVDINRYFKETEDGMKEIDEKEYLERVEMHEKRLEKMKGDN